MVHGTRIKVNTGTAKHIETLTRSVVYYSSKSYNLLPKADEAVNEDEAQLTFESVPEQEQQEQEPQVPSDPTPIAVYTAEDVANLQRQLEEAREEVTAKDHELAARDKIIEVIM